MSDQDGRGGRELPGWARTALLVLLGVVVLGGLILAFRPSPVPVDAGEVTRGPLQVDVREDGRTQLRDRYTIAAPMAGTLERVRWRPGDEVEAGEELLGLIPLPAPLLDDRSRAQARAALEGARAGLEQARAREEAMEGAVVEAREALRRQRILLDESGGSVSAVEQAEAGLRSREAELRSARFAVQAAEQEVENARLLLERGTGNSGAERIGVRSPVSGRVLRVMQESEAAVQPGSPVLEVGDVTNLEVVADLLSADAVQVRPGHRAEIDRWGGEDVLPARVRVVEPAAFTRVSALGIEEQRVNVRLDLDPGTTLPPELGDGYRVEARIIIWEEDDVLRVPASAVFRDGDRWFAFRILDGRARRVEVEVGRRSDADAQVLSGLDVGDQVVLYPGERIEDGIRVEARR
ncbi:MAG: HlyD family efflux transporter periplasmic adaptor subunit [Gemmatimonadales bacterium]|nr:MAG: HlyD family efflux transporter periplasmic adaptor subunit [Gemmatimonadales bacterium]